MTITNHGVWNRYTPDPWPDGIPPNVMWAKRSTDGVDWYTFLKATSSSTIKCVLGRASVSDPWTVIQAANDWTLLFPQDGNAVMEIAGTEGQDPEAVIGHIFSGGEIIARPPPVPEPPPAPTPVDLVAYAKTARWKKEVSDLTVGGHAIAMDDRSKSLIQGGYISAVRNPSWSTIWQGVDGEFTVNAAVITAVFDAMSARVNDCFTTYATVKQQIDGGTITTTEAIDQAFAAVT